MFHENARRLTPIWFAARPARPSWSTVSIRSSMSWRTESSMVSIGAQTVRSTGSPVVRMSRNAMGGILPRPLRSASIVSVHGGRYRTAGAPAVGAYRLRRHARLLVGSGGVLLHGVGTQHAGANGEIPDRGRGERRPPECRDRPVTRLSGS